MEKTKKINFLIYYETHTKLLVLVAIFGVGQFKIASTFERTILNNPPPTTCAN